MLSSATDGHFVLSITIVLKQKDTVVVSNRLFRPHINIQYMCSHMASNVALPHYQNHEQLLVVCFPLSITAPDPQVQDLS